jgi:branched-chain amino acid transport system ATP-binding protein
MTDDGTTVEGSSETATTDRSDRLEPEQAVGDSASARRQLDDEAASLVVEDLRKSFGGIDAVDGVSFSVERGSLTGLIGPNGAGKSTTFNLITGVHEPDAGSVAFEGEDLTGMRTSSIATSGLVRTFQIARELEEMTVLENLMLSPRGQSGETLTNAVLPGLRDSVREEERELRERVWETLELFEIDHLAEDHAGNLSGGQRKLLELARALMLDPTMMLLDEPFAGVNPTLEEKLLDRIHELRGEGLTFLLVEHDIDLIMENCEHVIVMHQGQILAEGPPAEIRSNDRVIDAYLGEDI